MPNARGAVVPRTQENAVVQLHAWSDRRTGPVNGTKQINAANTIAVLPDATQITGNESKNISHIYESRHKLRTPERVQNVDCECISTELKTDCSRIER